MKIRVIIGFLGFRHILEGISLSSTFMNSLRISVMIACLSCLISSCSLFHAPVPEIAVGDQISASEALDTLSKHYGTRVFRAFYGIEESRKLLRKALGRLHEHPAYQAIEIELLMDNLEPEARGKVLARFAKELDRTRPEEKTAILKQGKKWLEVETRLDVAHQVFADDSQSLSAFYLIPETKSVFSDFPRVHLIRESREMFEATFAAGERTNYTEAILERLAKMEDKTLESVLARYKKLIP